MNTPNIVYTSILCALFTIGCGPTIIIDELVDVGNTDDTGTLPCVAGESGCECFDGDLDGDGVASAGGECFLDLMCNEGLCVEADPFELFAECDTEGRCWVRRAWWAAWAQVSDAEGIADGIESGTLTATEHIGDSACFEYGDPAGTVCVLGINGIELHARPLSELTVVSDSACAGDGPWSSSFSSTFWCQGRFGELGVALREI